MISKNIVFPKENTAELWEEPVLAPKKGEVLVKRVISAISSGTERASLTGSRDTSWIDQTFEKAVFPRRVGYSASGVVVEVGEGVTNVKPGDRVAITGGTHNQYHTLSANGVYPIGALTYEEAAMLHIAIFPLAAIRKCRLEIGESAIVMGMGMLGVIALQLLKAAGAVPVIAVDPDPQKREKALRSGADYALDPYAPDFAKTAKQLTGGGAKVGIEVTGIGAGLNGILDCMARFGRVALLGCTRNKEFTIDYYRKVHGPGITLIGAHTMARPDKESHGGWWTKDDDIAALIKLIEMGRIHLSDLIDEVHSPAEAPEVFHRLAFDKTFPLTLIDWRELE